VPNGAGGVGPQAGVSELNRRPVDRARQPSIFTPSDYTVELPRMTFPTRPTPAAVFDVLAAAIYYGNGFRNAMRNDDIAYNAALILASRVAHLTEAADRLASQDSDVAQKIYPPR
jgi:hypothetical protein